MDPEDIEQPPEQQQVSGTNGEKEEVSTSSSWESPSSMSDTKEFNNDPGEVNDPSGSIKTDPGNAQHLETLAGNLVASLVDEDDVPGVKNGSPPASNNQGGQAPVSNNVPSPPPASHTWSYLDPQHQVQGPFQSEEMFEWYTAGYFPGNDK